MALERPNLVIVIAPNRPWFENWCRMDCDPPENPNDRKFVVFSSEADYRRTRGRHAQEGDRVILLGHPEWRILPVLEVLLSCGYVTADDGFGNELRL